MFDDLPAKVKVGCRTYRIEPLPVEHGKDAKRFGDHDSFPGLIRIREDLDGELAAKVLLHEILHGCFEQTDLDGDDDEHQVTVLTLVLLQVIQDNPSVIDWIVENARSK